MPDDLFDAAAAERLAQRAPLAARLRPRSLDEVVGQEHLLGADRPLRALIEADRLSTWFRLRPLTPEDVRVLLTRGLEAEGATADEDAIDHLADRAGGDGRAILTAVEIAVALAGPSKHVTLALAEGALDARALRYGRDEHYDVISAFIKSI